MQDPIDIASHCACLCNRAEPVGDAVHLPARQVRAGGSERGVQIRAIFQVD